MEIPEDFKGVESFVLGKTGINIIEKTVTGRSFKIETNLSL
jgi:hypothetical protein